MSPRRRISRQTSNPSSFGQHQVEDDEVRIVPGVAIERLLAVRGGDDRVALLLEVEPDEVDDVALVVDDQDRLHRGGGYDGADPPIPDRVSGP